MKNRDYFTRPKQAGGRTAHDYGNTRLSYDAPGDGPWWLYPLAGLAFGALFVWGILA